MLKSVESTYISTIRQVTKGIEDKLLSPDHSVQDQVHIRNNNNKILLLINGSDTKKKKNERKEKIKNGERYLYQQVRRTVCIINLTQLTKFGPVIQIMPVARLEVALIFSDCSGT